MIFVDTNVFMYAVGRPHILQQPSRAFLIKAHRSRKPLCTSAEVLQELAHAYLATGRSRVFDAAVELISSLDVEVWPLEEANVELACQFHELHPTLQARDLCHLASCRRRGVRDMKTLEVISRTWQHLGYNDGSREW